MSLKSNPPRAHPPALVGEFAYGAAHEHLCNAMPMPVETQRVDSAPAGAPGGVRGDGVWLGELPP